MLKNLLNRLKKKLKVVHPANELTQFKLFEKMNEAELKIIHELMHARHYAAGETLYEAGYPMELIFFIQAGELDLIQNEAVFRHLKSSDILGLGDWDAAGKRSHTAVAKSAVKLLALSDKDLRELRKNVGQLAARLNSAIANEIQKVAEEDSELA